MPTPKHTPGPWAICAANGQAHYCSSHHRLISAKEWENLADVIVVDEESAANAALIAAAPELLEALQAIMETNPSPAISAIASAAIATATDASSAI